MWTRTTCNRRRPSGSYAAAEHQDLRELLRVALGKLPTTLRTAVVLRDLQELSTRKSPTGWACRKGPSSRESTEDGSNSRVS